MKFHSILRTLPAAVAIACAGLALNATAQNANPTGPGPTTTAGRTEPTKILRGGEFDYSAWDCRSAWRKDRPPNYFARSSLRVVGEPR